MRRLLTVGLLAAGLFPGAGVARAAMAGANPVATASRPDLRTVSRVAPDQARFCFDRALANQPFNPSRFLLGGYRVGTFLPASAATLDSDPACVLVGFGSADLPSYSFGQVLAGAATSKTSGAPAALADSTANLGSTSRSGTAGHTVGPDLVGVFPGPSPDELIYSFDQPVDPNTLGAPSGFGYDDSDGGRHDAVAVTGVDNLGNVRVDFGAPVGDAPVRAIVDKGTVLALTPSPEKGNPDWSVTVPGKTGTTLRPDLVAAALVFGPGGQPTNQVDYTFDKPIQTTPRPAGFRVFYSDATYDEGESAAILGAPGGDVVRVSFPAGSANIQEEMVVASVLEGAAAGPDGNPNTEAGTAVGGNAGAFATGFSNGPDAFGVTFDDATGAVVVTFDQRVDPMTIDPAGFRLLDSTGGVVASSPSAPSVSQTAVPGPTRVTLQFSAASVAAARALEITGPMSAGPAVRTFPGGIGNVEQIVAPAASAAAFAAPPAVHRRAARWVRPRQRARHRQTRRAGHRIPRHRARAAARHRR